MFNPSDKQIIALENMYKYLWYKEVFIQEFETKEEFQELFDILIKKCKKQEIINKKIKNLTDQGVNIYERRAQKIKDYYLIKENVEKYARNYYEKYKVSVNKLKEKILMKNKTIEWADEISKKIAWDLEFTLLEQTIYNFVKNWKPLDFICRKIREKKFTIWKEEIIEIIESNNQDNSFEEIQKSNIVKIIQNYWIEKLKNYKDKSKIINKLIGKGYSYNIIKEVFHDLQN